MLFQSDDKLEFTEIGSTPKPPPSDGGPSVEPVEGVGQLFISYSRQDIDFVNRLRDDFTAHGIDYWIDAEGLSPGTPSWEKALRAAIDDASGVAVRSAAIETVRRRPTVTTPLPTTRPTTLGCGWWWVCLPPISGQGMPCPYRTDRGG